jgi:HAD superfamily hydrolase (TIGR01490 family)
MRLALFDLDGTVLRGNSWQQYFWWLVRERPALAPGLLARLGLRAGGLAGGRALREAALRPWRGASAAEMAALGRRLLDERLRAGVRPAARREIARAVADGCEPVLATGAFDFLAEAVAAELGVREVVGTRLEFVGGKFTGHIAGEEMRGEAKAAAVRARFAGRDVAWERSRAYSDAVEDAPLFAMVGEPVFVARGAVRAAGLPAEVRAVDWDAPAAGY